MTASTDKHQLGSQGLRYLAFGLLQISLDWFCFVALTATGIPVKPANLSSRIIGAAVGFWLNGRFTFNKSDGPKLSRGSALRFLTSWSLMTLLSTILIAASNYLFGLQWTWLIKPAIDLFLAFFGFLTSKYWIYK